jgi:hypothetical protein
VLAAVVVLAGCGGQSTTAKFKSGYLSIRKPANQTVEAIGTEITKARTQTDAQVGVAFKALATRFQGVLSQLETLKPPSNLQADWNTVTAAGTRLESDLNAVVSAAATHNSSAAEQAGASLVTDAEALKTAAATIKSKLKLK